MRFPVHYLLEKVLGDKRRKEGFEPLNFENWIRVTLRAANKATIQSVLDLMDQQHQHGRDAHAKDLNSLRNGILSEPTPELWAQGILGSYKTSPSRTECAKALRSLDAAYRFDSYLWKLAKNNNYDFHRHASDWIDFQQLFYLCDPATHILTRDQDFKTRTAGTTQASQILSLKTILD